MLRSLAASWTAGNPGPATLLFRQRTAQLLASPAHCHVRQRTTTAQLTEEEREHRKQLRERRRESWRNRPGHWAGDKRVKVCTAHGRWLTLQRSNSPQRSRPMQKGSHDGLPSELMCPGHNPPEHQAIRLAPPRDYDDIDRRIDRILDFVSDGKLYAVMVEWGRMIQLNGTSRVTPNELGLIAEGMAQGLSEKRNNDGTSHPGARTLYGQVGDLYLREPALFDSLRHMLIEAATHNHWRGLYAFVIELLRQQQPQVACETYELYKRRARQVLGIDAANLLSKERALRLGARLRGPGQLPLLLAQVAALTMLNRLESHDIMGLFGTTANIFSKYDMDSTATVVQYQAFWRHPNREDLIDRFRSNCDKVVTALYCYHPPALGIHIASLSSNGPDDVLQLNKLYNTVMESSIGPNRFITPMAVADRGGDLIPLSFYAWSECTTMSHQLTSQMHLSMPLPAFNAQTQSCG